MPKVNALHGTAKRLGMLISAAKEDLVINVGNNMIRNILLASKIQNNFNKVETANIKEQAAEAAEDLAKLVDEVTKPTPNKKWYSVSIEGLIKAAENMGMVGEPVINLSRKVWELLIGGGVK